MNLQYLLHEPLLQLLHGPILQLLHEPILQLFYEPISQLLGEPILQLSHEPILQLLHEPISQHPTTKPISYQSLSGNLFDACWQGGSNSYTLVVILYCIRVLYLYIFPARQMKCGPFLCHRFSHDFGVKILPRHKEPPPSPFPWGQRSSISEVFMVLLRGIHRGEYYCDLSWISPLTLSYPHISKYVHIYTYSTHSTPHTHFHFMRRSSMIFKL
jgi:hypothetical protein